jgi:hypothetical protein
MPRNSTGNRVSRAAATGGGRTYRGQMPVNWYAGLVGIVILGLFSIIFARYEYQHHKTTAAVQPAVGTTLYAAYEINICGKVQAPLTPTSAGQGITAIEGGVLQVSPLTASDAGNNATLGLFFRSYKGLSLSETKLTVLKHKPYTNGERCPSGTPDAGKKGVVKVEVWPNAVTTTGTVLTGNPADYKIGARSVITIAFVPSDTKLHRPSQSTIDLMLDYMGNVVNGTTTTTTAPSATTTTAASGTTTTAASGTTTTTAASGTTTTTTAASGTTTTTG